MSVFHYFMGVSSKLVKIIGGFVGKNVDNILMIDFWTCHICGKEQSDKLIKVMSYPMKGLPGATINVRYCADSLECQKEALKWRDKGEFPQIKSEKRKRK